MLTHDAERVPNITATSTATGFVAESVKRASDEGRIARETRTASGYPPNLQVLVDGVEDRRSSERARLRFLRRLPRDPFHDDPDTPDAETWGLRAHDSEADDPRPGDDVYDVHTLSERTGLNGIALKRW